LASLQGITGSYATTGSNTFVGTQTISASLNVSGSTNFNGAIAVNDANMNLTNSSSLNLTSGSSIYVSGPGVISGSIVGIGNVTAFSSSVDARLDSLETDSGSQAGRLNNLESYSSSLRTAITVAGANVTVNGNLTVAGTTTQVNSTTVQLGDNIIELNGTGAANGGIYVKDPIAANTATGSLIWDTSNDYWKAGVKDSEIKILLAGGDSVVSGSSQITLQSTTGFSAFDSTLSTITGSLITSASNAASRLTTLEGTGTIQGVGTTNNVTFTTVNATEVTASVNVPGLGASKRLAFRNTTGNLDFIAAPTTTGDIAQWDGSNFVMSNVIDGGSF